MSSGYVVPGFPSISVPDAPDKPVVYKKPPSWLADESFRLGMTAVLGVVGGVAIGKWGFDHMFVEGLEAKERKTFIAVGAVAVTTYGVVKLFQLDDRWLDIEGTANKASEYITGKALTK